MDDEDDFRDDMMDEPNTGKDSSGRPIVRHVVKDLNTALKMRALQAKSEADARKAEAQMELAKVKAEERKRKQELKAEIQKMRIGMSAVEKARTNIAITAPILLTVLIGGFIAALTTGKIPDEATATSAALLTLLVSGILANLRSVISNEGNVDEVGGMNGHDEGPEKQTRQPEKPSRPFNG